MKTPVEKEVGTCTICLEEFKGCNAKSTVVLECMHVFHFKCVKEWQEQKKKECPNCRHASEIIPNLKTKCPGKRPNGVSRVAIKKKRSPTTNKHHIGEGAEVLSLLDVLRFLAEFNFAGHVIDQQRMAEQGNV